MTRLALAASTAMLAATAALADPVAIPALETHVSPAGHAFAHLPVPEADYVQISLGWAGDAATTRPGKEGLYALGPALLFEEAGGRRLDAIAEDMADAGANVLVLNTLSGPQVILQAQTEEGLAPAAAVAHDALTDAALAPDDLDWLKDGIEDGLAEGERDPGGLLDRALGVLLADGDPRLSALSNRPFETVAAVTPEDVEAWLDASFDGAPFAVSAGPLTPEAAGLAIDAALAGLGERAAPTALAAPVLRTDPVTAVIDAPEAETALVAISMPVSPTDPAVTAAFDALAGGDGTRLFERLREADGATYGVTAAFTPLTPGLMTAALVATVPPERAREVLDALREELAALREGGLTGAELAAARERLAAQEATFLRDPASLAAIAMDQMVSGRAISIEARRESGAMTDLAAINAALADALPATAVGVIVTPRPDLAAGDCTAVTPEELTGCEAGDP